MRALARYVGGGLLALSAYCPLMFLEHTGPAGFFSLRTSTGDCIPGEQGQKLSVCRAILLVSSKLLGSSSFGHCWRFLSGVAGQSTSYGFLGPPSLRPMTLLLELRVK